MRWLANDLSLLEDWRASLRQYSRLFVGFSGGLDSTVLIHALASERELVKRVHAIHIDHGLSEHATAWSEHCQHVCQTLDIPFSTHKISLLNSSNIEEQARIARYGVFSSMLAEHDCLLLAHHADDQAETVLLQLFRGAGVLGLSAMTAVKALGKGVVIRPFLQHTRQQLKTYAFKHQLVWVEDESNLNTMFSRNYLRQQVMPLLEAKWPSVVENLKRCAIHCQSAQSNLDALAEVDCELIRHQSDFLDINVLQPLPRLRLANVLRVWFKSHHLQSPSEHLLNRIMTEVIFVRKDATPLVQWGNVMIRRYQNNLYLLENKGENQGEPIEWMSFPSPLKLSLSAKNSHVLSATPAMNGVRVQQGARLLLTFRQGGETFRWRGQTKTLKKLCQEWHIPPWQRASIPLLYIDERLAAIVGYAVSDDHYGADAINTYHLSLQSIDDSAIMD